MNNKLYDILVFMEICGVLISAPIIFYIFLFSKFSFIVKFLIALGVVVVTCACVILFFLLWFWFHTKDKECKDKKQSR